MFVPSIEATRSPSIALLPSSIQCRSSITRTSVLRRLGALTSRQTIRPSARCRASALICATGRSGSGTPRKSNISGRSSAKSGSSSSARPAIFSRASCSGSRSPIPKKARSICSTGMNGIVVPCACACASKTSSPSAAAALGELVAEPALADPGFGDQADRRRPRPAWRRSSAARSAAISSARPTKREKPRSRERSSRERACADPGQLEDADRPARPLDLELAEVLEVEEAGGELGGVLGHVGLAGLGQRLHPLRQADRVADRRVVAVAALADRPGDDLAGVDPDPGREVEPRPAAQLGRVVGDVVEHLQGGVTGAPRVVLVGDRRPEDGHDPVAGELVDGALEPGHRVGQDREEALHDLAPLLRVLLLGEVHRAADVGEQHRHLLALGVVPGRLRSPIKVTPAPLCLAQVRQSFHPLCGRKGLPRVAWAGCAPSSSPEPRPASAAPRRCGWTRPAGGSSPVCAGRRTPKRCAPAGSEPPRAADPRRHRRRPDRRRRGADRRRRPGAASTASSTTPASPSPGPWRRCRSTTSAARSRST